MQQTSSPRPARPPIHMSEADYDRIADMALRIAPAVPSLAALILDEIDRAELHAPGMLPADIVALGSEVEFLDTATGRTRRVRLVLPRDADIEESRISVLTPVGAGLIGMRAGGEIDWPCPDGRMRLLKIIDVRQPD